LQESVFQVDRLFQRGPTRRPIQLMALDALPHVIIAGFGGRQEGDAFTARGKFLRVPAFSAANTTKHQNDASA
jgi:hypothetical protein